MNYSIIFVLLLAVAINAYKPELKIVYDNDLVVEKSKELLPTQVRNEPKIEWDGFEPNALYTLIMYDPDAPSHSNPTASPFLHWLVINIKAGNIANADVLAEYIGAGPPKNTGLHRYKFVVFKQGAGQIPFEGKFATKFSRNGRPKFDINSFVLQHQLGDGLANNEFKAQWDEYVPTLHKQLSKE